jgi:hypothetical protein
MRTRPGGARGSELAGQPLVPEDLLGFGVFRRSWIDAASGARPGDHVAAAVVRAQALEQAERRQPAAERESATLRAGLRRLQVRSSDGASDVPALSIGEWRQHERANLEAALRQSGGRVYGQGGAAALLGVPPTTLASRLKVLGVPVPGRRGPGPS